MTLLLQNREPTMALYMTMQHITEVCCSGAEGLDAGKLERRGLLPEDDGES